MSEQIIRHVNGYRIGSETPSSEETSRALVQFFESPKQRTASPLNGRGNVVYGEIPGLGRVVVKRYLRGGVFRHLIRSKYFRWGPTRAQSEFDLLKRARAIGINAPEPIFYADRGWPLYDAWLVTREIEGKKNFAEYCKADEQKAMEHIGELARQISLLIEQKIFHVDLHPGNAVIDHNGKVYLLDFDKAEDFAGSKNALRDLYLVRWRRAVIKHGLPEWVSEMVCPALRKNFKD